MLLPTEIVDLDGLRVTSKLRTICDLGMQLPRRPAFAAMCMMMKVADFTLADISRLADTRFKGYRWVNQLRSLTPHLEPRLDSPGECWLVLCWLDELTLPDYEPQFEVAGPGGSYFLDLAVPELRYAAEYDGVDGSAPISRPTTSPAVPISERNGTGSSTSSRPQMSPARRRVPAIGYAQVWPARAGAWAARLRLGVTQVPGQRSTA